MIKLHSPAAALERNHFLRYFPMAIIENIDVRESLLDCLETGTPSDLRQLIAELHPGDIADALESLLPEERLRVWFEAPDATMGEILLEVSDGVREALIRETDPSTLVRAVRDLDIDDIAELVPDLSSTIIADVMITVDKERRQGLDAVLSYEEGTAGRLMDLDVVTIRESLAIGVVLRYLRLRGELPEYTDRLYVVNRDGLLKGVLLLRTLVTSDLARPVRDFMDTKPVSFTPDESAEEVTNTFERYDLAAAPIVDAQGKLLGRITVDDVVEVINDAVDHKFMVQAGLDEEEDIFAPIPLTARKRAIWLGINLVTAVLASWVIGQFEETIEKLVALAVLMPIIASMGGNAGTQTLTSVIRGLGVGTISPGNVKFVLKKEFLVGGLNGLVWALVVAIVAIVWYQNYGLAVIVAIAMLVNIGASTISGVLLPIILDRLNIDPALAGGVALTTITDVVGFLAILGLAALILV